MAIKLISGIGKHKKTVFAAIKKYGYGPEHNFWHYTNLQENGKKNIFVSFGKSMGILGQRDAKNVWYTVDDVLAPEGKKLQFLSEFLMFALEKKKAKKVVVETLPETRRELMKTFRKKYHFPKIRYSLYSPIFSIKDWDPQMKGGKWKKIRNLRNRLYRFHSVKITDSKKIKKTDLMVLLDEWIKKRFFRDEVLKERYINLINSNFKGCGYCRSLVVDGKVSTLSAGWRMPNSKNVYSAIGILNYSFEGLGEAAYIDELNFLKRKGFMDANFGGSDMSMLRFKKKFRPVRIYRTDVYAIIPRKK